MSFWLRVMPTTRSSGRAGGQAEQLGVVEAGASDLDQVVGRGHLDAVDLGEGVVERALARGRAAHAAGQAGRSQAVRSASGQRRRAWRAGAGTRPRDRAGTGPRQRPPEPQDLVGQHGDGRAQALALHRGVEAAQDLDLLDQLALADEGALAAGPVDVALLGQVDHGLAHRREADPERLGQLALARELLAGSQPALLDPLQDSDFDLVMQRHRAVPVDSAGQALRHGWGRQHPRRLQSYNLMSRGSGPPGRAAGDRHPVHLGGPVIDPEGPDVGVDPAQDELLAHAQPAGQLHRAVDDRGRPPR